MKYISLKYGPESIIGVQLTNKAEVEMLAHRLSELHKDASLSCYSKDTDRRLLAEMLLRNIKPIVQFLEQN